MIKALGNYQEIIQMYGTVLYLKVNSELQIPFKRLLRLSA